MFNNFQVWKLHTVQDYVMFFLVLLSAVLIFYFIIKSIYSRRNDQAARKRVQKKLAISSREGKLYNNVTFSFGGRQVHFDHLLVDAAGLVAVRSIGWGIKVYGSQDQAQWKVTDNKTEQHIENPVQALVAQFEPLRRALGEQGLYGFAIDPLAVFADPFAPAELYLGRDSCCVNLDGLTAWCKQRRLRARGKTHPIDVASMVRVLDAAVVKTPAPKKD